MAKKEIKLTVDLDTAEAEKNIEKLKSGFSKFADIEKELSRNFSTYSYAAVEAIGKSAVPLAEVEARVKALDALNLKAFGTVEKLNEARMQALVNELAAEAKKGEAIDKTNELYKKKEQLLIEQSQTTKKKVEKEYALLIEAAEKTNSDATALESVRNENFALLDKTLKEELKKNNAEHYAATKAIVDKSLKETTELLTKNIYHGSSELDKDLAKKKKRLEDELKKQKEAVGKRYTIEIDKAAHIQALEAVHNAKLAKMKEEAAKKSKEVTAGVAKQATEKTEEVAKKAEEAAKKAEGSWKRIINVSAMSKNIDAGIKNLKYYSEQLTLSMRAEILRFDELGKNYENDKEGFKALQEVKNDVLAKYAAEKIRIEEMMTTAEKRQNGLRMEQWKLYMENTKKAMENVSKHAAEAHKYLNDMNTRSAALNVELTTLNTEEVAELTESITAKEALINNHQKSIEENQVKVNSRMDELRLQGLTEEQIANDATIASLKNKMDEEAALKQKEEASKKEYEDKKRKSEKHRNQQQKIAEKIDITEKIAKAAVDVSAGVAKALSYGPILGPVLAAIVTAMGAIQIASMTKRLTQFADGGLLQGKPHAQGGMRIEGTNIEVEGGEYVVNRETTSKNIGLVRYINSQRKELSPGDINTYFTKAAQGYEPPFRRMFAAGGQVPAMHNAANIENDVLVDAIKSIRFAPKVAVTDIIRAQDEAVNVDGWTGM